MTSLRDKVINEINLLQSLGAKIFLCPFVGRTKFQMIGYFVTYFLVSCTAFQLMLTIYFNISEDLLEVINIAPNLGVVVMALMKYTKLQTKKRMYEGIIKHYRTDIWEIVSNSRAQKNIIERYKGLVMIFNRFLVCYSSVLTAVVLSFPYLVMKYDRKFNGVTDKYLYPFDGWYPFDKTKWYWTAYIWESLMTTTVIWVYSFVNLIHADIICFICMELRIIGNHLEELLDPEKLALIGNRHDLEQYDMIIMQKLKILISKHHYLAKTSDNLDAILGNAMLLNYSLGAVFICLTAFTCTVVDDFYKSIRYFFMCMSLLLDIFYQCLYGQIISDHSLDLADAVYSSDWPNSSAEVKKIMLMFMVRTQKSFKLTAKRFIPMNMNTFSRICSSSYQMFNLLRTMFAKKLD